MALSRPLWIIHSCVPQETNVLFPHNKSGLYTLSLLGRDGWISTSVFCEFIVSVKNVQKRPWPISSHLDLTLGQKPICKPLSYYSLSFRQLTSFQVNVGFQSVPGEISVHRGQTQFCLDQLSRKIDLRSSAETTQIFL